MLSDFCLDRIINTGLFMEGALERPLFVGVAIFGSIPYPKKPKLTTFCLVLLLHAFPYDRIQVITFFTFSPIGTRCKRCVARLIDSEQC